MKKHIVFTLSALGVFLLLLSIFLIFKGFPTSHYRVLVSAAWRCAAFLAAVVFALERMMSAFFAQAMRRWNITNTPASSPYEDD